MSDNGDREFEVFNAARRLPPAERAVFLEKICVGDPTLRQRIETLLKVGDQAPGFLENPVSPRVAPHVRDPSSPSDLAAQFPQLEIIELIGKGGMGTVYKARQPKLDRFVALKILAVTSDPGVDFGKRFLREARTLARLNHPGIVAIYDFGQTADYYFLVMEYVDGMNLRELLKKTTVSAHQALDLVMQICAALQYAHDQKVIHRDIKPENILINKNGMVKIADFGLAKLMGGPADPNLTQTQTIMGTPNYMAPEQREKPLEVDHRADIYSLGVVFYEMLTGEVPLGRFDPPSKKVRVDVRLDEVVLRALDREPIRRYQKASEVRTGVENIAATMKAPGAKSPGAAGDFAWKKTAAGLIVVAALIVYLFTLKHRTPTPVQSKPIQAVTKLVPATDPAQDYQQGFNSEHGIGCKQDYAEAAKWYLKAAEAGLDRAQNSLGTLYERGYGVEQDYSDALFWYRKAAKAGLAEAMQNTSRLDDLQNPGDSGKDLGMAFRYADGQGVPQDPVKAAEIFRRAAEAGNAVGEFWLAESYLNGRGVPRDYAQGAQWHLKSAETGNAQGETGYARDLEEGRGVAQNYIEAAKWYRKSGEAGFAMAQVSLGNFYENGLGVEKSDEEAARCYRMAAASGYEEGLEKLNRLTERTNAVTSNVVKRNE